jgi:hypothetical protein
MIKGIIYSISDCGSQLFQNLLLSKVFQKCYNHPEQ